MHRRTTIASALVVTCLALVAVAGGIAAADGHYDDIEYEEHANYTVQFPDDRTPGEEISVIERARSPVDVRNMDTARIFTPMNADPCADGDIRTFGIDRGSNNSGTDIDEPLIDNYKDDYEGQARVDNPPEDLEFEIWADFWDEGDFQDGTHITTDDTIILYREDCYIAPDEPGWYQAVGMMNGTDFDGDYAEGWAKSDYFWIGDFEDEEEAREELGPPPSERDDESTSTPTPEPAETETPTPTPEPAETDTPTPTPQPAETETPTPTEADGADGQEDGADEATTPAAGDGPGFGVVATLTALLGTVLALRRRW